MNRPTVEEWRIFVKAVQLHSFAKVAESYGTDPAYIGKAIARLEAYLGEPLFIRTRPKLSTTWLAEHYLPRVSAALLSLDRLFDSEDSEGATNRYRIGVPVSFSKLFLHWISDFQEIEPGGNYEIVPYDLNTRYNIGQYDLVVAQRTLPIERVFANFIGKHHRILIASREAAQDFNIQKPEDLRHIPLVSSRNYQTLTSKGVKLTLQIRSVIKVADALSALECVLHRHCCAIGIPIWATLPLIENGQCVQILPDWTCEDEDIWLVRPERKYRNKTHRKLADYLTKRWKELEASTDYPI